MLELNSKSGASAENKRLFFCKNASVRFFKWAVNVGQQQCV